ncbi:nhaD, partial [Symbiodinium sp. CCMP2456]
DFLRGITLRTSNRRSFAGDGLAMALPSRSPAVLEAKSQLAPKAGYVGSFLVLLGMVFVLSKRVPQFATEGTNHRRLSETTSPQLASSGCCRFAKEFEGVDWHDPKTRADYMANVMYMERGFLGGAAKLSFDPDTGMTYDGVGLDDNTGEVQHGTLRTFSAPSKEALHLSLLALALQPVEDVPAELATVYPLLYSTDEALDILEKKAKTMEDFDANYPGFGGFLPWFCSRGINKAGHCKTLADPGTRMTPVSGWERTLPGLDNGQLAFGTAAVVHVLERRAKQEGTSGRFAQAARRWNARLERMKESVVNLFYNGAGLVRMVSELDNITVDVAKNASNAHNENGLFLWDAFEGEMIVLFLDIFGNWTKYPNNGEEEKKLMWTIKAEHVEPVVYTAADDTKMVLQKGYWFSAHEQWKTLQLPYMDIPLVKHLFANGEFARLENSVQEQLPGLMASVNAPNGVQCDAHPYCSAVGIQSLAGEPVFSFKESETVLTPYAAFPSILVDPAAGLAWYNHMLAMPRVQTPVGSIESFTVTGKAVAPMATWDAKVTTVLAMLGGTGPLLRSYMEERGVYGIFEDRVKSMYEPVFKPVITSVMPGKASVDLHIAQLPQLPWPAPHPASKESVPEDFPSCRCLEHEIKPGFLQPKNP